MDKMKILEFIWFTLIGQIILRVLTAIIILIVVDNTHIVETSNDYLIRTMEGINYD